MLFYKKYLVITVILFFTAIIALFGAAKIFIKKEISAPAGNNAPAEIKKEEPNINIDSGPEIQIQSQTGIIFPLVGYKNGNFKPTELKVSPEISTGTCLITVLNEDPGDLILRVSPYSPEDKIGFKYDPIPSGKSLTLDPRYGEIAEISFHNRKNPEAEFRVILDKTCF